MDIRKQPIAEFDREVGWLQEEVPEDTDFAWKPNPKSFSLGAGRDEAPESFRSD
jgi:hypothetical protein